MSDIKWPSKRIPQGGLFHPPKVKYSKETSDLIKLLMEEAKMSMIVRKRINYHLRSGDPLPLPPEKTDSGQQDEDFGGDFNILRRMRMIRKKPLETIKASGAYEVPKYRPKPDPREPIEKAKLRLQEKMSGFKMSTTNLKPLKKPTEEPEISLDSEDRIDDLLQEINERVEWLAEMEDLGEGKHYRNTIHSQIAERLNEIRKLQKRIEKGNKNISKN